VRALAYASGQAASAAVLDLLDAGSHVIAPLDFYGGTRRLFDQLRRRVANLDFSFVDQCDLKAVAAAVRPNTRLLWIETPSNPLLRITDIAGVVAIAKQHGMRTCLDNTFATPVWQRPLELGVDIVMHSATKYLGGHSDVLGGLNVVANAELGQQMHGMRSASGAVLGPFDSYLVLRGIKTLALRMARHGANAQAIAEHLERHPRVARVHYPGLKAHPQHALASRQMSGHYGAVVSFELEGDAAAVKRFLDALHVFAVAESLGAVESLAGQCATMSHSSVAPDEQRRMGITPQLVRLSVGIEAAADLIADLDQALSV
jgi:cystathionine gamma-lyase